MKMSREEFLKKSAAVAAGATVLGSGLGRAIAGETERFVSKGSAAIGGSFAVDAEWEAAHQELIAEFVLPCHFSIEQAGEVLMQDRRLVNARNYSTDEAGIEAASHTGRPDIAQWLLGHGAPYTVHCAVMMGHVIAARAFFDVDGSQAGRAGAHGIPMMYHGALSGNIEMVELIEARGGGADYDWALCGAAQLGHADIVEWLLERTGNPNYQHNGKTPLDFALRRDDNHAVVELLTAAGAVRGEQE
ncbi:MAG TPA: ankyrin repeat domain-containing protein [Firmicutes bacterium]|nr:ankyrin repeat domain-containing protein [Bacillota bacterium]